MPPRVTDAQRKHVSDIPASTDATWKQWTGGSYSDAGIWEPGTMTEHDVTISFTRDITRLARLQVMPDVPKVDDMAVVYYNGSELDHPIVSGTRSGTPDEFSFGGEDWVIWKVMDWNADRVPVELVAVRKHTYAPWVRPAGSITPEQSTIDERMREVVAAGSQLTGDHVLAGYQTGGELTDTHAVVRYVRQANGSETETSFAAADEVRTLDSTTVTEVRTLYRITFIGEGAADAAQRFRLFQRSEFGYEVLEQRDMTYGSVGAIYNLTELADEVNWRPTYALDVEARYVQSFTQRVPAMQHVTGTLSSDVAESETLAFDAEGTAPRGVT